jgi:hypothetical protein
MGYPKPEESKTMVAENKQQQNIGSTGEESDSLMAECDDVQFTTNDADLIISANGTSTLTAQVTVVGTNCNSSFTCVWDGHRWICS